MKINLNKKELITKFFNQITKITDKCVLTITPEHISCLTNTQDGNIILYGKYQVKTDLKSPDISRLNLPAVDRLSRILSNIPDENIELDITSNCIVYDKENIKFKYYLLEDGIIEKSVVSVEKLGKLTFDCSFDISYESLNELSKAGSFIGIDKPKVYFFIKDNKIFGEITDKTMENIDSVSFEVSDKINGTQFQNFLPIDLEIFRMISTACSKGEKATIKINTDKKVIMIELTNNNDLILKYIISALVK